MKKHFTTTTISKRLVIFILLISLLCSCLITVLYIVLNPIEYESNTSVYISAGDLQAGTQDAYTDLLVALHLSDNYSEIVRSTMFAEKIIQKLKLPNTTPERLAGAINAKKVSNANILHITVRHYEKALAKQISHEIPVLLSEMPSSIPGALITVINNPTEAKTAIGEILFIAVLSLAGAFLLAFAAALLFRPDSNIIRTPEDVERTLGIKVTGTIPDYKF